MWIRNNNLMNWLCWYGKTHAYENTHTRARARAVPYRTKQEGYNVFFYRLVNLPCAHHARLRGKKGEGRGRAGSGNGGGHEWTGKGLRAGRRMAKDGDRGWRNRESEWKLEDEGMGKPDARGTRNLSRAFLCPLKMFFFVPCIKLTVRLSHANFRDEFEESDKEKRGSCMERLRRL